MNAATSDLIGACWLAWLGYWLAMAFATRRTMERGSFLGYRLVMVVVVAVLLAGAGLLGVSLEARLWSPSPAVGMIADLIVIAGAAFTVWARIALGPNWSAEITFKQDHELIRAGPYALVRHPIYTGLIAMALGTSLDYGRVLGFVLFAGLCASLWWKARGEEQIMTRHFPHAYPQYRSQVHAIIPFVL